MDSWIVYALQNCLTCCGVHSKSAQIPNNLVCVCVVYATKGSVFRNCPKYKGDSAHFFGKCYMSGLIGDVSPICRSQPWLGHDTSLPSCPSDPLYPRFSPHTSVTTQHQEFPFPLNLSPSRQFQNFSLAFSPYPSIRGPNHLHD